VDPIRFQTLIRRQFVNLAGKAGGFGAAYLVMQGLGLLPDDLAHASPPELEPGSGSGSSVAILGAGLAGLTAAYLLGKAGYDCHLLEARERPVLDAAAGGPGRRTWRRQTHVRLLRA
jgi:monoamine oxidase